MSLQSYVLVSYTQKFGDYHDLPGSNNDQSSDAAWGNAYNGMALASAVASMLIGLFILIAVPERTAPMSVLYTFADGQEFHVVITLG